MKKFIKNNWFVLLVIIIFSGIVFYEDNNFINDMKRNDEFVQSSLIKCQNEKSTSTEESFADFCDRINKNKDVKVDFYTMLSNVLYSNVRYINLFAFLILVIPSLIIPSKLLKYNSLKKVKSKENYQSFIVKFLKSAFKYIWLLPLLALIIILPITLITTFDPTYSILYNTSIWTGNIIYHPIMFIALYILNIFLYSCIFINISLIILRKQHNYILAIILSFLCYVGIELFLEVAVNIEISNLFNIISPFMFSNQFGIENLLIFTFVVFGISILGLYLSYRNKEKLIIDCKNNK